MSDHDQAHRTFTSILLLTALKGLGSLISLITAVGIANFFGAGPATDAFFFARRVTSNLAVGLERTFHLIQVPPLVQYARRNGLPALRDRLRRASATVLAISLAITLPAMILAEPLVRFLAPGFTDAQLPDAVFYFRILLLTLPISATTALSGATMNALRSFSLPVLVRLAPRLAVVMALALVPLGFGFPALAWAVLAGTLIMGAVFTIALRHVFTHPESAKLAPPAENEVTFQRGRVAAMLIAQAYMLGASWIDLAFASLSGDGSVATYDFAQRLVNMTPGLVTNSVMLVYYTEFATALAGQDDETFRRLIRDSLRLSLFFVMPIGAALFLLADPLVSGLLQHGRFSADAAQRTAVVMAVLALLLPVNAVLGSVTSAIFADNRLPHVKMMLWSNVLSIIVRVAFDYVMVPRMGIVAVPLGVVLSMTVLFVILSVWVSLYTGPLVRLSEAPPFLTLVAGTAVTSLVVWLVRDAALTNVTTRTGALVGLTAAGAAGTLAFLVTTTALGLPEARSVLNRITRRLRKRNAKRQ